MNERAFPFISREIVVRAGARVCGYILIKNLSRRINKRCYVNFRKSEDEKRSLKILAVSRGYTNRPKLTAHWTSAAFEISPRDEG